MRATSQKQNFYLTDPLLASSFDLFFKSFMFVVFVRGPHKFSWRHGDWCPVPWFSRVYLARNKNSWIQFKQEIDWVEQYRPSCQRYGFFRLTYVQPSPRRVVAYRFFSCRKDGVVKKNYDSIVELWWSIATGLDALIVIICPLLLGYRNNYWRICFTLLSK